MYKIVTIYWMVLLSGLAVCVSGQAGQCQIEGVTLNDWLTQLNIQIKDTDSGLTFRGRTTNIAYMFVRDDEELNNPDPYVTAEMDYDESELTISLEDHFKNYEKFETKTRITTVLNFVCMGTSRSLVVYHNITDTNNHSPTFLPENKYNINTCTPLPVGFPIVPTFETVYVEDLDLTTYEIVPYIEPNEYVDFIYDGPNGTFKIHKFKMVTKKVLNDADLPIEIRIEATDKDRTGDLPRTTTGILNIGHIKTVTPSFSMPFYRASLIDKSLVFDQEIIINEGFDSIMSLKLIGDDAKYFNYYLHGNAVKIMIEKLPVDISEDTNFLLFSLEATKNKIDIGRTVIHVKLPQKNLQMNVIKFEKVFYEFNYSKDAVLTGEEIVISEGYSSTIQIKINGDFNRYFMLEQFENICKVTLAQILDHDIIDNNQHLILTIEASNFDSISAISTLIINLPKTC